MASSRSATVRPAGGGRSGPGGRGRSRRGGAGRGSGLRRGPGIRRLCRGRRVPGRPGGICLAAGNPDGEHAAAAGELAEVAFDGLLGAPPQFAGLVVPDDVGGVVVAVRAQRLAEPGVVAAVPGEAGVVAAVRAAAGVAAGVAGLGPAGAAGLVGAGVLADRAGVDRAEGRGGEGDEHGRVGGDGRGDAFAADEPGAEELVGVAAVGLGAAGADGGAAVAARLVDHPVGHADRGDGAQEFAGGGVDVAGCRRAAGRGGCRRRRARCDRARPGSRRGAARRMRARR